MWEGPWKDLSPKGRGEAPGPSRSVTNDQLAEQIKGFQELVEALDLDVQSSPTAGGASPRYEDDLEQVRLVMDKLKRRTNALQSENDGLKAALVESEAARLEESREHANMGDMNKQGRHLFLEDENAALHRKVVKLQLAHDQLENTVKATTAESATAPMGSPSAKGDSPVGIMHSAATFAADAAGKIKDMETTIAQLRRLNLSLETEKVVLRQQIEKALGETERVRSDMHEASRKQRAAEEVQVTIQSAVAKATKELAREHKQRLSDLESERDAANAEALSLEQDLRQARQQLRSDQVQFERDVKALVTANETAKAEILRLESSGDVLVDQVSALQLTNDGLREDLIAAEARYRTAESSARRYEQDDIAARSSLERLKKENQKLLDQIAMEKQQLKLKQEQKQQKRKRRVSPKHRAAMLASSDDNNADRSATNDDDEEEEEEGRGVDSDYEDGVDEDDDKNFHDVEDDLTSESFPSPRDVQTDDQQPAVAEVENVAATLHAHTDDVKTVQSSLIPHFVGNSGLQSRLQLNVQTPPSESPLSRAEARDSQVFGRLAESLRREIPDEYVSGAWDDYENLEVSSDDPNGAAAAFEQSDNDDSEDENQDDNEDTADDTEEEEEEEEEEDIEDKEGEGGNDLDSDGSSSADDEGFGRGSDNLPPTRPPPLPPTNQAFDPQALPPRRRQRTKSEKKSRIGIPRNKQMRAEEPRERLMGGDGSHYSKNTLGRTMYRAAV